LRHIGDNLRFIPTRVGTTNSMVGHIRRLTVHPHARGDNHLARRQIVDLRGSSPRAWGQRRKALQDKICPSVHPHARGDNHLARRQIVDLRGSSPRAWGQRRKALQDKICPSVHPHARGDNEMVCQLLSQYTVHPHARGDNPAILTSLPGHDGSSPRAWGQRNLPSTLYSSVRFIPTRVGTTAPYAR